MLKRLIAAMRRRMGQAEFSRSIFSPLLNLMATETGGSRGESAFGVVAGWKLVNR
jgi:hypothetical protein